MITSNNNVSLLHFELLYRCAGLVQAVSKRSGRQGALDCAWSPGDNADRMRRTLGTIATALEVDPASVCCARQVHGIGVKCIDALPELNPAEPCRVCGEYDALITGLPGITLLIRVADCVPIMLFDPVRRVVAVVHAGWKGTLADIVSATVERMCVHHGCRAADLLAGIGPSIGPCCFEVGADVAEQFRRTPGWSDCVRADRNGYRIDLAGANRASLQRCGVLPHNVEMSGYCTACRLDIFFSHRGEQGNTGRFGLFAGLRA
jgi:polyphenol oxidase